MIGKVDRKVDRLKLSTDGEVLRPAAITSIDVLIHQVTIDFAELTHCGKKKRETIAKCAKREEKKAKKTGILCEWSGSQAKFCASVSRYGDDPSTVDGAFSQPMEFHANDAGLRVKNQRIKR
jgi:hypothetical protein